MLLILMTLLSLAAAGAVGWVTDAFSGLGWIWILPLTAVGTFLLLAALAFGFLLLVCAQIDPDKPREKDSPWFRRMVMWYIQAILTILPVKIRTKGMEKTPKEGRFLLVCNHLDNIDPAFLYYCFPKSQLSFVAKKETRNMFLVDKVLPKLLCQLIDRENDREALKTILRCISLLKNDTVSIAIFPEGRINSFRKLAHFRPGVFKIAQKAQVPIVVCTLRDTQYVLGKVLKLRPAAVDVHLLDVIPVEEVLASNTVELADRIYRMMAEDLGPAYVLTPEEEEKA